MSEIARFYGIVIKMFFKPKEHEPSHIHALYARSVTMSGIDFSSGEEKYGRLTDCPSAAEIAAWAESWAAKPIRLSSN